MDIAEYPGSLSGSKEYIPPAERKRAIEEMRSAPPPATQEPPKPPERIGGRTRQEFVMEFVLTRQANATTMNARVTETVAAALTFWEAMACDVGYDE